MKFIFGSKWLEDRSEVIDMIRSVIDSDGSSASYLCSYKADTLLFKEGDPLHDIYILLEGIVNLYKVKPYTRQEFLVSRLQPGALIGIISFTTRYPSLTTAKTETEVKVMKIPGREMEELFEKHPEMQEYLDEVILANLLERYRQSIILKMKLESVNLELKKERNELKKLYEDLKQAQGKLIYQEKMATLGQLVAGFAHEVNNPTAALIRSVETLEDRITDWMVYADIDDSMKKLANRFFEDGKKAGFQDTREIRQKMSAIEKVFPGLPRNKTRTLAQVSDEVMDLLKLQKPHDEELIGFCTGYFEMGRLFRNINSSGNRIANLVRSLKSYSRSDSEEKTETIDIREGIHDTLQLTSNRIKYYDVKLNLEDVPDIEANPAALNQVWTNIILNAADAMGKRGSLEIACRKEPDWITVTICDSGPGIPENMLEKIFEPSVTTKHSGAKFGLGLGLAISKNIIEQHGGRIKASNRKNEGACFRVQLPIHPDGQNTGV